ncbi:hypothetical protein LY13_003987 [Prauserella aidingensis]|uniref:DUF6879 family protein n=1 Tax=Prauserella aidingensis TaxID=387890 RepID=UPI0020A576B5|nr:DUF6879 family protein [Prauserella aidingensis]MCP2255213.1 hypothetical protein [Prauserella aidingensis]
MTVQHLAPEALGPLLDTVRHSSWRWECQGHYAVDEPALHDWQAGRPAVDTDDDRAWRDYIARLRQAGIPFGRLRMLTEPLTPYLEWMVATSQGHNVAAGEDLRWIAESRARDLAVPMPENDFYILDGERVVTLRFDPAADLVGIDVDDTPATVAHSQRWRDTVWPHATHHADLAEAR